MKLNFVTWNEWKFKEAKLIIPGLEKLDIDLTEIQDFDIINVIKAKLTEAFTITKQPCVVEDTGLYFDWLNGFPWPFIKWMLKSLWNEWIYNVVNNTWNNKWYSKSCIGYVNENWEMYFFEWIVHWKIVKPRWDASFWWNPIFIPDWTDKTFWEMDLKEKENFSMRWQAFKKLKEFLDENNSG